MTKTAMQPDGVEPGDGEELEVCDEELISREIYEISRIAAHDGRATLPLGGHSFERIQSPLFEPIIADNRMELGPDELAGHDFDDRHERPTEIPAAPAVPSQESRVVARPGGSAAADTKLIANKYRVERVIGRSRIAVNLQVRHMELQQRFLLLHLHADARSHVDLVNQFQRGARQALQLSSEHVVHTTDAGRLPSGVPFVALDYPSGTSLRKMLHIAGPLPVAEAVDYILQCAVALAEAHALGIHHGRLSTAHLYFNRRPDGLPQIKVLGFGIADALCSFGVDEDVDLEAQNEAQVEKFGCIAPEQVRFAGEGDELSDVWGLGAALHELLTASPPFQASTTSALVAAIAADPPQPVTALRPGLPAGLEAAVLRCLEKDKRARFPSVADFATAIEAYGAPESQRYSGRIVKTLARSTRPPAMMASSSALVHVGPAQSTAPVSLPTPPVRPPDAPASAGPSRASMAALTIGALFAIGGAGMLGAGLATRQLVTTMPQAAVQAIQPAAALLPAQVPGPTTAATQVAVVPVASASAVPSAALPAASAPTPASEVVAAPSPPRFAPAPQRPLVWQKPAARPAKAPADQKPSEKSAKSEPQDLFDDTN